jgi:hypothetical protein
MVNRHGSNTAMTVALLFSITMACGADSHLPIVLSLPADTLLDRGQVYHLPIHASQILSSDDVTGFNFQIVFPAEAIHLHGYATDTIGAYLGTESGELLAGRPPAMVRVHEDGILNVGWYSTNPIVGTGVLFYVDLVVEESARAESTMTISIEELGNRVFFNERDTGPAAISTPGLFTVRSYIDLSLSGGLSRTVKEGDMLDITVSGSALGGEPVSLSASGVPVGATWNDATGVFSWRPDLVAAAGSPYVVTFTAISGTEEISKTVTIIVTDSDPVPPDDVELSISGDSTQTVAERSTINITVTGRTAVGRPLFLLASGVPVGATWNDATGVFSWTPDYDAAAGSPYVVTFTATSGDDEISRAVTITVTDVPDNAVVHEARTPEQLTIRAWPNPFNGRVSLGVIGVPGEPVEGVIVNQLGTVVHSWTGNGGGTWSWNGRNRKGKTVGSGVYLVIARTPSRRAITRVTFVR